MNINKNVIIIILSYIFFNSLYIFTADYYISSKRGSGQLATLDNPALDLGNIIHKLRPGDTVHITGGTYLGRGENGSDVISVPVSIIGGYNDYFSFRDPFGKYKTIMSGSNKTVNYTGGARISFDLMKYNEETIGEIVIDGLIIDNGERNRYNDDREILIVRYGDSKTGENPTPDTGGILIKAGPIYNLNAIWKITVKNCIVMNTACAQGAVTIFGHKNSEINISDNLIINNTGVGLYLGSTYNDIIDTPKFYVEDNTVLFTLRFDQYASNDTGVSVQTDAGIYSLFKNNLFGFNDKLGFLKNGRDTLTLIDNMIINNVDTDFYEAVNKTRINVEKLKDEAIFLTEVSSGNISDIIYVPVSKTWSNNYARRFIISKKTENYKINGDLILINTIRKMLGLESIKSDAITTVDDPVWLNRLSIDEAINTGMYKYKNKYGCSFTFD
ncbi:MAG: hypothetical protein JXB50_14105 [Spirochaetes bacterium]|nr:hypothetical protein [Spirochaetota bacterium]